MAELNLPFKRIDAIKTTAVNIEEGSKNEIFEAATNELAQVFSVNSGSTFRTNDLNIRPKSYTADVFRGIIGANGLPISLVLDGCGTSADNEEIQQLAEHLLLMLNNFCLYLEGENLTTVEIGNEIKKRYLALNDSAEVKNKYGSDAAFAANIIFRNHVGNLTSFSFGSGDALIAKVSDNNEIETVIAARNVNGNQPISFPIPYIKNGRNKALANLEIDVRTVNSGDRLLFLTDGAYENFKLSKKNMMVNDENIEVTSLSSAEVGFASSVKELSQTIFNQTGDEFNKQNSIENRNITVGDDFTIAQTIVPNEQLAFKIQLKNYINVRTIEAGGEKNLENHFFSFWGNLSGMSGKIKANAAKKILAYLNKQNAEPLTLKEYEALHEGRLGKIFTIFKSEHPDEYKQCITFLAQDLAITSRNIW